MSRKEIGYNELIKTISLLLFIFINFLISSINLIEARNVNVPGFFYNDNVKGGEGFVNYYFNQNNVIKIASNYDIEVQIIFDHTLSNKKMALNITENSTARIIIESREYGTQFQNRGFKRGQNRFEQKWNSFVKMSSNLTIEKLEIRFSVGKTYSINNNDKIAVYKENEDWEILETRYISENENGENEAQLSATLMNIDTPIYISVFSPAMDYTWIYIILILIAIAVPVLILMSKTEYREFIKSRIFTNTSVHRLSIEEVLENENRSKILDFILEEPGIHFNELLRRVNISPGNLVWHLDILESYKIIGKKNIGHYICYFPYYNTNPIKAIDIQLAKSKITLEILNMIQKNPGIYVNQIAKALNLDHKTIIYHIKKLIESNLVENKKVGRKNLLYVKSSNLSELKIDTENIFRGKPEGII